MFDYEAENRDKEDGLDGKDFNDMYSKAWEEEDKKDISLQPVKVLTGNGSSFGRAGTFTVNLAGVRITATLICSACIFTMIFMDMGFKSL